MREEMARICKENLLEKKYLIVPRLALGYQILEEMAPEQPWINIEVVTPARLARVLLGGEIEASGLRVPEDGELEGVVEKILAQLKQRGQLEYFAVLQDRESLSALVYPVINELRLSGIEISDLNPDHFINPRKGKEMQKIYQEYERVLEEQKIVDRAAIIGRAMDLLPQRTGDEELFLIPEDLELFPREKDLLNSLNSQRVIRLPGARVEGIDPPRRMFFSEQAGSSGNIMASLYGEQKSGEKSLDSEIMSAYGAASEVRGWLRRILKEEIPLEQVQICYVSWEKYAGCLWNEAQKLDIPLTMGEGISAAFSRPGRLFLNLLRWAERGYPGTEFYQILRGGDLKVENGQRSARLFRRAAIGWGKEWYLRALPDLKKQLETSEDKERAENLERLIRKLLEIFPDPREHGAIDPGAIAEKFLQELDSLCALKGSLDAAGREGLEGKLQWLRRAEAGPLTPAEAYSRLRQCVNRLRIGAERPQPGALHATHYRWGQWCNRPFTVVVGMDSERFPGRKREDPVLLDREREKINSRLFLQGEDPERKRYRMLRFLVSREGRAGFSFELFDPGEMRRGFPSAFLLQIYRKISGNEGADYTCFLDDLPPLSAYTGAGEPGDLNGDEWWLGQVLQKGYYSKEVQIAQNFPDINRGLQARNKREQLDQPLGPFEGCIDLQEKDLPSRFSASRLEVLATCPFRFFLESILRVRPPEEFVYEPGVWLDHLTRGLILHDVYRDYVAGIEDKGMEWKRLEKIAEKTLQETSQKIPPPHEHIFIAEKQEFLEGLRVFWKMLQSQLRTLQPVYLEVPFGLGADTVAQAGDGLAEPVTLQLNSGREMEICGRIDRIDLLRGRNSFWVWDYKTGGAGRYSPRQVWAGGRQVQPALYARAAAEFLHKKGEPGTVEKAGYLFPSERGEGQEINWEFQEQKLLEILDKMMDLMQGGLFPAIYDKGHCSYCDYQEACRYPADPQLLAEKLKDGAAEQLQTWKELKDYE